MVSCSNCCDTPYGGEDTCSVGALSRMCKLKYSSKMTVKLWFGVLCLLFLLAACRHPTGVRAPSSSATPVDASVPSSVPYAREFPNVAADDAYLVGAYWYPWYGADGRHWNEGYRDTPLLGTYDSADPTVINRQIDWATGHGVDFFVASWWGRDSFEDAVIHGAFTSAELRDDIRFAILYESMGLLEAQDGTIDLDSAGNRQKLVSDMRVLAERYFTHPGYLRVDDRPVVFLYLTRIFIGDVAGVMAEVRDEVCAATGHEPFIIGDEVYWQVPVRSQIVPFDGVTAYNMHTSVPGVATWFGRELPHQYQRWAQEATAAGVAFVPDVIPGFDDTAVRPEAHHPVIPRSLELFTGQSKTALALADPRIRMVMITSWNEWHEGTSIEPAEEFGFTYLDALRQTLLER